MAYGTFLLADISGHSRYLDQAGLQHAGNITAKLLNSLIAAIHKRWRVANLEGDAVFFLRQERVPVVEVLAYVGDLYAAFFDRVLDASQDVDCGCGACGGANRLTVKFIVHAGRYEERPIGGRRELIGPDVVVAHRLMKPEVPLAEYMLLSGHYLGDEVITGLPWSEGELQLQEPVPFVVVDLTGHRREAEASHEVFVSGRDALERVEIEVAAPPSAVWSALVEAERIRAWSGASEVIEFPAGGGAVGTSYRWILPDGYEFGQLLIAIDRQRRRLTLRRADLPPVRYVYTTYAVDERDGGSVVSCTLGVARRLPFSAKLLSRLENRHPMTGPRALLARLKTHCEEA